jgi:hypothetical protein
VSAGPEGRRGNGFNIVNDDDGVNGDSWCPSRGRFRFHVRGFVGLGPPLGNFDAAGRNVGQTEEDWLRRGRGRFGVMLVVNIVDKPWSGRVVLTGRSGQRFDIEWG